MLRYIVSISMNSKQHKTDAKILARSNSAKKKNFHLKYIPLKNRRKNITELAFSKSEEGPEFHKTNLKKIMKAPVIADHFVMKKIPEVFLKYPDVISSNVAKKTVVSSVQEIQNPIINLKTNDKLKVIAAKPPLKKASTKSNQKLKPRTKQGFTEKITSMWHYAKSFLGLSNSNRQKIVLKDKPKAVGINTNRPLLHKSKSEVNVEADKKEQFELKNKPKKDKKNDMYINLSLQQERSMVNVKASDKEQIEVEKQILLKNKPKNNIKIETTHFLQYENKSVNVKAKEKEKNEVEKQMVLKDKLNKDIILDINTPPPLCEILSKVNCYESTLDDNAIIVMEIKNAAINVPKDKQIQPQTLNVNCPIETLNVHKNAANCEQNILTILNTCKIKQNNVIQRITHGHSKVPINKVKKFSSKVVNIRRSLNKKKQLLVKEHDTKKRIGHTRHRSCKQHQYRITYSYKHGCRHHKIKHIKQKCSTCRRYISTDHSQQEKAHHAHNKKKIGCVCKKRVICLYRHEKKAMKHKHHKKPMLSEKHRTLMKNRNFHNFQKKKRTLTVCTNSRRNSFKSKKFKRSVRYISTQIKLSTSKILPTYKYSKTDNSKPYSNVHFRRSIFTTDSDSDSDKHDAAKVLNWWYLHYALNSVQQNGNDELPTRSDDTKENRPFIIPYEEFCNIYEAVSKAKSDSVDSSINENWNTDFKATSNFPKHSNSFTDEESMLSEDIYPNSSLYSSIHNFDDTDTNTSIESSSINLEIPNNTLQKSMTDLLFTDDEYDANKGTF